jgi:hypothetical protein
MNDGLARCIYVLAGMPASGSAGLLQQDQLANLFGKYSGQVAALRRESGKSAHSFRNLKARADAEPNFQWPARLVLHVEITAACSFKLKPYESFRSEEFVLKEFRNSLSAIFSHYNEKVINTIEPNLPLFAAHYFALEREPSNVSLLYKNRDEETLGCIFKAWYRYLADIGCSQLRTNWDDRGNRYRVTEMSQQKSSPTSSPNLPIATFSPQWRIGFKPER